MFKVLGQVVDVVRGEVFPGSILCNDGKIIAVDRVNWAPRAYIMPGLIDAHVHIESSMLVPSEFAKSAVVQGTVGTVSDPHEIANVMGLFGVRYMIENGKKTPFHFHFGAPSCVPATRYETAGAVIDAAGVEELLADDAVGYLAEVMNYPGVTHGDPDLLQKIAAAKRRGKPVDGHAPGLRGPLLSAYIDAGITTDHEAFTYDEAKEKLQKGMKILIREGSAAKNFEALIPLLDEYPDDVMFCTDDIAEGLQGGHIAAFLRRAVARGSDPMTAIRAATRNPCLHYGLDVGLLQKGDPATFITVNDLQQFEVLETWISGTKVAERGKCLFDEPTPAIVNRFECEPLSLNDIRLPVRGKRIKVIEAIDGELITRKLVADVKEEAGYAVSDPARDILKLVVVNRYRKAKPAVAFIKNFGLKRGAIASTVAHDSHNIIAVGTSDEEILLAINRLIELKGGMIVVEGDREESLPLPIAGLMSDRDATFVSERYAHLTARAKELGTTLEAPFITLSFMALLVIPELKLSDLGLFDGQSFGLTDIYLD